MGNQASAEARREERNSRREIRIEDQKARREERREANEQRKTIKQEIREKKMTTKKNKKFATMLQNQGFDPDEIHKKSFFLYTEVTPFYYACYKGDLELCRYILAQGGQADVSLPCGSEEWTPLLRACRQGHDKVVEWLLREAGAGGDVHVTNKMGNAPLSEAARMGHLNVLKLLVLHGALDAPGSPPPQDAAPTAGFPPAPTRAHDEDEECAICLDLLGVDPGEVCELPCSHRFHHECVAGVRKGGGSSSCPLCRAQLPPGPGEVSEHATQRFFVVKRRVDRGRATWGSLSPEDRDEMQAVARLWVEAEEAGEGPPKAYVVKPRHRRSANRGSGGGSSSSLASSPPPPPPHRAGSSRSPPQRAASSGSLAVGGSGGGAAAPLSPPSNALLSDTSPRRFEGGRREEC